MNDSMTLNKINLFYFILFFSHGLLYSMDQQQNKAGHSLVSGFYHDQTKENCLEKNNKKSSFFPKPKIPQQRHPRSSVYSFICLKNVHPARSVQLTDGSRIALADLRGFIENIKRIIHNPLLEIKEFDQHLLEVYQGNVQGVEAGSFQHPMTKRYFKLTELNPFVRNVLLPSLPPPEKIKPSLEEDGGILPVTVTELLSALYESMLPKVNRLSRQVEELNHSKTDIRKRIANAQNLEGNHLTTVQKEERALTRREENLLIELDSTNNHISNLTQLMKSASPEDDKINKLLTGGCKVFGQIESQIHRLREQLHNQH